jgi:hypothetical protein
VEFRVFRFIVEEPTVFLERDGNAVNRQVAERGFRVGAGDSQRLVTRDNRFALFQTGVCHVFPFEVRYIRRENPANR